MNDRIRHRSLGLLQLLATLGALLGPATSESTTPLADMPIFADVKIPGNLALTLSVEFPTAVSVAHLDATYSAASTYLGYFDPNKCYRYVWNSSEPLRHFAPAGAAPASRSCSGGAEPRWSGNFLNWATMQTIDPLRWVLTGGYRAVDTATETLLERAWASGQGGTSNFPNRTLAAGVADSTPVGWATFKMRVQGLGNQLRFTRDGDVNGSAVAYNPASVPAPATVYSASIRVKVCDTSAGAGPLESNCALYPSGAYKPVGLMQRYSQQMRYSVFGYLNDSTITRDGGVLRARKKFIGPMAPAVGGPDQANPVAEWDPTTGVMVTNPDPTDASQTATNFGVSVTNSGALNYINRFGQVTPGSYKTYDPVGELYYAASRYYRNLGNVPEWTAKGSASAATLAQWVDGFPVITTWDDPILYSCQRNFILGIGDVNSWPDKNVPGSTSSASEPAKPAAVTADTALDTVTVTNRIGALEGLGALGNVAPYGGCCLSNSALMAGLGYWMNATDIRPDSSGTPARTRGKQTVQTYWLDVFEFQTFKPNNQFYLTTKYGGARLPADFDLTTRTTPLPEAWWRTGNDTVGSGDSLQPRPDNYFSAARPDQVVSGLTGAFARISAEMAAHSTSFTTASPQLAQTGSAVYAAKYDSRAWSGEIYVRSMSIDPGTGVPSFVDGWSFSAKLDAQTAGTGWTDGRRVVAWDDGVAAARPFRWASLSDSRKAALDTVVDDTADGSRFLDYLRGNRSDERGSTSTTSPRKYRDRVSLVGDVAGSRLLVVGPPSLPLSEAGNPGYAAFRTTYASRKTVVYAGTNAGMLHAIDGALSGGTAGTELFAYLPGAVFDGPTGQPAVNGLKALADPDAAHFNRVDGPQVAADIDLGRTVGGSGTQWRTMLIGGLGKGGRRYHAIDITDPAAWTSESAVATSVKWEFSDPDLGYTYGEPVVVKTRAHGWVVIFGSGYNNTDGKGYFFVVNPRTGGLIAKVSTGVGSPTGQAGLAQVNAFVLDRTDGVADAVYAGDLLGNLWRLDLSGTGTTPPAPQLLARLERGGVALPVTTQPLITVEPQTMRRWVAVGTGRMLHVNDIADSTGQRFYAIQDGTTRRFARAADLPPGVTFPIGTDHLQELTDPTTGITPVPTRVGWYLELGTTSGAPSWRVVRPAAGFYGTIAFASTQPSTTDACAPSGSGRVYAIDLRSGRSRLTDGATPPMQVPFRAAPAGSVTDVAWRSVSQSGAGRGSLRLMVSTDTGQSESPPTSAMGPGTLRRVNWREVPSGN